MTPRAHIQRTRLIATLTIGITLSGCSTLNSLNPFSSSSKVPPKSTAAVASAPAVAATEATSTTTTSPEAREELELVWKSSGDDITSYHLHYGASPEKLEHHLRIPVNELEKIIQPDGAISYRLKLRLPSLAEVAYVAIQAENAGGISPMTPAMKVQ